MTTHRDLKKIIRDRQRKTGESYTAARLHVMRERSARLGLEHGSPATSEPDRVDAVILKVNQRSARVCILGEDGQTTFRSSDTRSVVPGHLVTLVVEKRWTWRGDEYASGSVENPRIDIEKLGLEPLHLRAVEHGDLRSHYEPYEDPDPYAPFWRELTEKPRRSYEMDPIAWGALPGLDVEESPTCDAAELMEAGESDAARNVLMDVLCQDLRCIDAHGQLGTLELDHSPQRAILHYEIGIRIAELSLPPGFDGVLPWGRLYNRPFLRCLHGYGLCLWRLGELAEAQQVFERILWLNPNDNQGVRICWQEVSHGLTWEEARV